MKRFSLALAFALYVCCQCVTLAHAQNEGGLWRARASATDNNQFSEEDTSEEIIFGREIAARVLGQYKLANDAKLQKYVNQEGTLMAENCSRPELEFHFAVIESAEINAYSTPGGYVFVTTAAVAGMENEAELAGVLAHEIGHVVERHIVKELNLRGTEKTAVSSLAALIGGASESVGVAFSQAVDKAVDIIFRDGYSKEDEMQADMDAVLLSAFAGYDPAGLFGYLDKVSKVKTGVGKTYPLYDIRLATLQKVAREEGIAELKLVLNGDRFQAQVQKKK